MFTIYSLASKDIRGMLWFQSPPDLKWQYEANSADRKHINLRLSFSKNP